MDESQQHLYTIGEVAKLTGVPIKTIRYYTDVNLLPATQRTEARFRLYSPEAIWQLQLIRILRQLEFSLEEIRAIIGGNLSISTAIDWQLDAIAHHIHQLQRVQEVLQQAKEARQHPEQSLSTLYELGLALSENAAERSRFITEKLHILVKQANLPDEWRQQLLEYFTWQSPDAFTTKQIATWTEIVSILNDPAFTEDALRFNSPTHPQTIQQMNITEYSQQALTLMQQAQSAALRGDPPESETVQTLTINWIRLIAQSTQQSITTEFLHRLSAQVSTYYSERMQRFWTLMASLSGWEAPPSYREGLDLLAAGLRSLVSPPVELNATLDDPNNIK
ncbi:MAG TPA: MerR family transcriptional regulator [Ktedonobacteraceae bacterium]